MVVGVETEGEMRRGRRMCWALGISPNVTYRFDVGPWAADVDCYVRDANGDIVLTEDRQEIERETRHFSGWRCFLAWVVGH
jgi:hypothetical protein